MLSPVRNNRLAPAGYFSLSCPYLSQPSARKPTHAHRPPANATRPTLPYCTLAPNTKPPSHPPYTSAHKLTPPDPQRAPREPPCAYPNPPNPHASQAYRAPGGGGGARRCAAMGCPIGAPMGAPGGGRCGCMLGGRCSPADMLGPEGTTPGGPAGRGGGGP